MGSGHTFEAMHTCGCKIAEAETIYTAASSTCASISWAFTRERSEMKRRNLWAMLVLLVCDLRGLAPAAAARAGDWPGWRGPRVCGTTAEKDLILKWDGKTGKGLLWKTPPGAGGHSSPIVWGDRVFATTTLGQSPEQEKKKEMPDHYFACCSKRRQTPLEDPHRPGEGPCLHGAFDGAHPGHRRESRLLLVRLGSGCRRRSLTASCCGGTNCCRARGFKTTPQSLHCRQHGPLQGHGDRGRRAERRRDAARHGTKIPER